MIQSGAAMTLRRCKDQNSQTIEEFYEFSATFKVGREGAKAMLRLLARLRQNPDNWIVFGLTSHERLGLKAEDDYWSRSHVIIDALNDRNYKIDQAMPGGDQKRPEAWVHRTARSEDEAVEMILLAMKESGGWT